MPTLVIAKLAISASYVKESECPATENNFDTVQWWLTNERSWRIATYSADNDIRIFSVGKILTPEAASLNTRKHYADIVSAEYIVEILNPFDTQSIETAMNKLGGASTFEFSKKMGVGFWNPDQRVYKTISKAPPSQ
jgi:hypothetical protein